MRVLIEKDDGALIEAREIESVPPDSGILIFRAVRYKKRANERT